MAKPGPARPALGEAGTPEPNPRQRGDEQAGLVLWLM